MDNSLSLESITGQQGGLKYYSTSINMDAEETGYMDFDSYLKVLAAQMSNQDFNDPMSDAEFMQQMASYSMMEAIAQMNQQSQISYATSLVGKAVTVSDGSDVETGIVESVVIGDKNYSLLVNGKKYTTDQVTDVVDLDAFSYARSIVGLDVNIKDGEGNVTGTGKISQVYFKDGEGYAVVGKNSYTFDELELKKAETESAVPLSDTQTENTEITYSSANVAQSKAASGLVDFTVDYALDDFDDEIALTGEDIGNIESVIDGSDGSAFVSETSPEVDEEKTTDEDEASAAIAAGLTDEDVIEDGIVYENRYDPAALTVNDADDNSDEVSPSAGVDEGYAAARVIEMNSSVANTDEDEGILYSAETVSTLGFEEGGITSISEGNNFATGEYGITYGSNSLYGAGYNPHSNPNRAFADEYPSEAALADIYGSKMYDIRYINNTDVSTRLRKNIAGYTESGRAFTEIGFSGKGSLGEVVTWADGTQRVEVISDIGSVWYTTTGRYTLDQITDFSTYYDLSPFEQVIRANAMEFTPEEQSYLDSYSERYLASAREYWAENPIDTNISDVPDEGGVNIDPVKIVGNI